MSNTPDHLTDDVITRFLRTRSADPGLGLLDDIMRTVGAAPQDRPWLGLRPILLPRRTLLIVAIALLLATMGAIAVGSRLLLPDLPAGPFLGTWVTIDPDGSTLTMVIRASGAEEVEIEVHDDLASVCSGAPSTITGTGRLEETELVAPSLAYTCDDGSEPEALSGPPLQERLRDLTFVHDPESDTLTDNLGAVWERVGAEDPSPDQETPLWPQSSVEEVREAQRLADAGDPRYTWQLIPELGLARTSDAHYDALYDAEILARFLREELGWVEFRPGSGSFGDGTYVEFMRCAPGRTNPLYPDEECAPTIDDVRYETVQIDVDQLDRQGPTGIWVVTRWAMATSAQVVPPSDAETTALLEDFLQARIEGEGAEEYVDVPDGGVPGWEVPLLYATTSGAPYERSEFEVVGGPEWPDGWMQVKVQLFAENGETVVEQFFSMERDETGLLRLGYAPETEGPEGPVPGTTENGQAVPVLHSFLDGEVTFHAAYPWESSEYPEDHGPTMTTLLGDDRADAQLKVLADPRPIGTGCQQGPAPADAEALARTIRSDPDLEATAPVAVSVGVTPALRMDVVTAPGASVCHDMWGTPLVVTDTPLLGRESQRMRLYLLDFPGGSARILAIAIIVETPRFELVVEAVAPIVDSFEFHEP